MGQWLKNVVLSIQAVGHVPIMLLAEEILPRLRLYAAAEYLVNTCYGRPLRPDVRELALARVYERAGEIDRAVHCLRRAIAMRPDVPDNYLFLGLLFARHDRPFDAIRAFEQAIDVAQDRPADAEFAQRQIENLRET
jgi:tetratricopeptide (TPR) repeat protein